MLPHVTARHPHFKEANMTDERLERLGLWVFLMLLMLATLLVV